MKRQTTPILKDGQAVRVLEYTVSTVSWVLYFLLWWYNALEAASVFLFVPTYFATSLIAYHVCFGYLVRHEINKKTVLLLAGNFWTLGHYLLIFLKIVKH